MQNLKQGINLNTIILAIVGVIATDTWNDHKAMKSAVQTMAVQLPYVQADIAQLKMSCINRSELELEISKHLKQLKSPHQQD